MVSFYLLGKGRERTGGREDFNILLECGLKENVFEMFFLVRILVNFF